MSGKKKYKSFTDTGDFYTNISILTIQNAAMEYRKVLQYFVKHPESKWKNEDHTYSEISKREKQIQCRNEIEFFFGSDWFKILTKIPAEKIVYEIWKEVGYSAEYKAEL